MGSKKLACMRTRSGSAQQLGIVPDILRRWSSESAWIPARSPESTSEERPLLRELEQEARELRRVTAILEAPSASFAAHLDRPSIRSSTSRHPLRNAEPATLARTSP